MRTTSYITSVEEWKSGFYFYHPIKVRFFETDMFGHVNNSMVFTYFEEARIEFFKSLGLMQDWMNGKNENIPVVADLQCDYFAQTYFDESLHVFVKIAKVGSTSLDLHYMCQKEDGTVAFVGRGTIVQINKKVGKPTPWGEKWVSKFQDQMKSQAIQN